jgi:phosphoglycolate phosphatase-like HAD superfamily hydrolase
LFKPHFAQTMQAVIDPEFSFSAEAFVAERRRLAGHYGGTIFGWAAERGLGVAWVVETMRRFNARQTDFLLPLLARDEALLAALAKLRDSGHLLAIITVSHREYACALCRHLGITEIIPEEMVFDVGFHQGTSKHHVATYHRVMEHLKIPAGTPSFMVEDSLGNLVAAKEAGCVTLFVGGEEAMPEVLPPAVDYAFADTVSALRFILEDVRGA